jgi:pre-mRNA-splicing factor CWC22
VRKRRFQDNPGIVPELDLIEEQDKITHNITLDDEDLDCDEASNFFSFDPLFSTKET